MCHEVGPPDNQASSHRSLALRSQSSAVFGTSVAADEYGKIALIAAAGGDVVYSFTTNGDTWAEGQELRPSNGAKEINFGISLAIDDHGDMAVIGAPGNDNVSGVVHVFIETALIRVASDPSGMDAVYVLQPG